MRNRVWTSLPPVTLALTVLYVLFTVSHALLLPADIRVPMVVMAGSTAVLLFVLAILVRVVETLKARAHALAFILMLLIGLNSAVHVYMTQDVVHTTNVMLVVLGSSFLVLSTPWYVLTLIVTLGSWAIALAAIPDQTQLTHFAFALFSATLASLVIHYVHTRDLVENHRLRQFSDSQREKMEHLATHDPLTGLANRRKFHESLLLGSAHAKRTGRMMGVLYIDLDNFKGMNDTHGHEYGDEVLKAVAGVLQGLIRETDVACRLGGDEFAIILSGLKDASDADVVVAKLHRRIKHPEVIKGIPTEISLSVGQVLYPDETEELDELLRVADQRMYAHKEKSVEGSRPH